MKGGTKSITATLQDSKEAFTVFLDPARTAGMEPMLCERGPITVRAGPSNHPGIRVL
ncbi:MAG TPA: hypothetical protein PKK74_08415 [Candidatus Methanoculleus thermohydrogenotrophicum]|nr:hypothetical protein [Candidatus Methanoculleus thermohydrogenotrophicum]NLM81953.1 hypothetical protein [Candidatus Methanoculleus thermohydrogenotrophicum]HOB18697.1 hypothetical protein [Candidatus Methanoculleus thermohydrogenotrophicum]HPZ38767.1 hypothetical protein [Candidatus Methanoculleus thermohydrogenotrophicum]HQC91939.1 hypothetical protein [Candidatus Methanoculleus thermohydrogenotrophicum]